MYSSNTKRLLLGCCLLCVLVVSARGKPQITKLFPVEELVAYHQSTNNVKPLDKFLGKLRATYNFVFHKQEDTSNVAKILAKDEPNPDIETLKLILENVVSRSGLKPPVEETPGREDEGSGDRSFGTATNATEEKIVDEDEASSGDTTSVEISSNDWLNGIEAPKPLGELELQEDADDYSSVESVTTESNVQLPAALGRHLLEWLGSLLGLTYGAYAKVAQAIKHS